MPISDEAFDATASTKGDVKGREQRRARGLGSLMMGAARINAADRRSVG